jgi:hypothetical protein
MPPVTIMTLNLHSDRTALRVTLDDIVDAPGLWPVLRALVARRFRRNRPLPPLGLNAHLRRDIGLPPLEDVGPTWGQPR